MFHIGKDKSVILSEKHEEFLKTQPYDPITGDFLIAGDEVVVCKRCNSVLLKDSVEYLGGVHCNQTDFTADLPIINHISVQKNTKRFRIVNGAEASSGDVFGAWVLDTLYLFFGMFVFNLFSLLFLIAMHSALRIPDTVIGVFFSAVNLFLLFYHVTRDAWFGGRSLGKKTVGLYVVDQNCEPCSFGRAFLRTLLSPLYIFTPFTYYAGTPNFVDSLSQTRVVKGFAMRRN
jgi:uncharacterized RDD family membrane protein YckC